MQKEPAIATVHHGNSQAQETSGAIAQFMRDPVSFRNGVGAKQRGGNRTVSGAVETAIKGAQGKYQSVATGFGKRRRIGTRTAAVESAPEAESSGHPDFKESIERQENRSRICAAAVQMHPHLGAEACDEVVFTFSG